MAKKRTGRGGRRQGAGRPAEYDDSLVTFSVSMPLTMARWVADQATALSNESGDKISRSRVIVACIDSFMKRDKSPRV